MLPATGHRDWWLHLYALGWAGQAHVAQMSQVDGRAGPSAQAMKTFGEWCGFLLHELWRVFELTLFHS